TTNKMLQKNMPADTPSAFNEMFQQKPNVRLASYNAVDAQPVDMTQAAENSVHAVEHIRSTQTSKVQEVEV
ncbi:deoxyribonuclease HsdR, partial [Bacteroides cellulosilyticus]|nr:deoxyribonuclease HsdR [Bacteroides cellulosilyticus]